MAYPQHDEAQPPSRGEQPRSAFTGPRLDLPRFQFAPSPSAVAARQAPAQAPAPAPDLATAPTPAWLHSQRPVQPQHEPMWQATATAMPGPQPPHAQTAASTPQLSYAPTPSPAPAPMPAYARAHVASAPALVPAARPMPTQAARAMALSNATSPANVSWNHSAIPLAERTLLQRITPVHMGVLMVMVVMAMIVTSGPAAMNAKPSRLPALAGAVGGGGGNIPSPIRAGTTAVNAAKAPAQSAPAAPAARGEAEVDAAAPRVRTRARTIAVGNARVRANVRAGGIPSPAASANLAIAGGGRVSAADTGSVRMGGIPSPAASEQLGPQKLPFRPTDGVTLPRLVGERDSHAIDTHYGVDTLPMEEPALPAMTPGASAAQSERQVQINAVSGASNPAPVAGGLAVGY